MVARRNPASPIAKCKTSSRLMKSMKMAKGKILWKAALFIYHSRTIINVSTAVDKKAKKTIAVRNTLHARSLTDDSFILRSLLRTPCAVGVQGVQLEERRPLGQVRGKYPVRESARKARAMCRPSLL